MNKLLMLLLILTVVNTVLIGKHMLDTQLWDSDCHTDQECEDLGDRK